jgi:hypothetical protein
MNSRIFNNIVLVAMLCGAAFISIVFGLWVYYMSTTIYEIALALEGSI